MTDEGEDSVLGVSHDGSILYKRLLDDNLDHAIGVLNAGFYEEEPLCKGLRVAESPQAIHDLNQLFKDMSQDSVSVVAIDTQSQKVVGVCFNKLETRMVEGELDFYEIFKRKKSKEDKVKFYINFLSEVDLFEKYKTNAIVDLVGLAVLPTHTHRGIGKALMENSLKLIRSLNVASVACIICSSTYTLHIARKLGFAELLSVPYDQIVYEGRTFSDAIEDHSNVVLVAKEL